MDENNMSRAIQNHADPMRFSIGSLGIANDHFALIPTLLSLHLESIKTFRATWSSAMANSQSPYRLKGRRVGM
eukprot:scaffold340607_cov19-Prasinocladus_malaysianus.AAC.1